MNKGETLANILRNYTDFYLFLHNTKELNTVNRIMIDGFLFENQLSHSTDRVNPNEPIEVAYFFLQRKDYGFYTMVMGILKETYQIYSRSSNLLDLPIEDIMTINKPFLGDNDEYIYTLPAKHVLGYFNQKTEEFFINPSWDPSFINIQKLPQFDSK